MNALVTGGNGFVGRAIVELLIERGDTVTIFSRSPSPELQSRGLQSKGANWTAGDVRDLAAITQAAAGHDVVFHTAARVGLWGKRSEFVETNIRGTENVIAACRANGISRLVYTSSPSVIYAGNDLHNADETLPYPEKFTSFYPESKAMAEQLVIAAAGDGLLSCSLRPHLIWGPGDNHLIPKMIERAKKGALIIVGDGNNLVDFTYIDNVAQAHILAADSLKPGAPSVGQCYFISQDEPIKLWDFVGRVLTRLNLPLPQRKISRGTARALGHICEVAYKLLPLPGEPRMTPFLADQLATSHHFSIAKARKDFGYHPQVSMAEGIERLAQAYFNNNDNRQAQELIRKRAESR